MDRSDSQLLEQNSTQSRRESLNSEVPEGVRNELVEARQTIRRLQDELEDVRESGGMTRRAGARDEERSRLQIQSIDELSEKVETAEQRIKDLQEQLTEKTKQLLVARQEGEKKGAELKTALQQLEEKTRKISVLERQVSSMRAAEGNDSESHRSDARSDDGSENSVSARTEARSEYLDNMRSEVDRLNKELAETNKRHIEAEKIHERRQSTFQVTLQEKDEKVELLKQQLEQKESEVNHMKELMGGLSVPKSKASRRWSLLNEIVDATRRMSNLSNKAGSDGGSALRDSHPGSRDELAVSLPIPSRVSDSSVSHEDDDNASLVEEAVLTSESSCSSDDEESSRGSLKPVPVDDEEEEEGPPKKEPEGDATVRRIANETSTNKAAKRLSDSAAHQKSEKEKAELRKKLKDLQGRFEELKKKYDIARKALDREKKERQRLSAEVDRLRKELAELRSSQKALMNQSIASTTKNPFKRRASKKSVGAVSIAQSPVNNTTRAAERSSQQQQRQIEQTLQALLREEREAGGGEEDSQDLLGLPSLASLIDRIVNSELDQLGAEEADSLPPPPEPPLLPPVGMEEPATSSMNQTEEETDHLEDSGEGDTDEEGHNGGPPLPLSRPQILGGSNFYFEVSARTSRARPNPPPTLQNHLVCNLHLSPRTQSIPTEPLDRQTLDSFPLPPPSENRDFMPYYGATTQPPLSADTKPPANPVLKLQRVSSGRLKQPPPLTEENRRAISRGVTGVPSLSPPSKDHFRSMPNLLVPPTSTALPQNAADGRPTQGANGGMHVLTRVRSAELHPQPFPMYTHTLRRKVVQTPERHHSGVPNAFPNPFVPLPPAPVAPLTAPPPLHVPLGASPHNMSARSLHDHFTPPGRQHITGKPSLKPKNPSGDLAASPRILELPTWADVIALEVLSSNLRSLSPPGRPAASGVLSSGVIPSLVVPPVSPEAPLHPKKERTGPGLATADPRPRSPPPKSRNGNHNPGGLSAGPKGARQQNLQSGVGRRPTGSRHSAPTAGGPVSLRSLTRGAPAPVPTSSRGGPTTGAARLSSERDKKGAGVSQAGPQVKIQEARQPSGMGSARGGGAGAEGHGAPPISRKAVELQEKLQGRKETVPDGRSKQGSRSMGPSSRLPSRGASSNPPTSKQPSANKTPASKQRSPTGLSRQASASQPGTLRVQMHSFQGASPELSGRPTGVTTTKKATLSSFRTAESVVKTSAQPPNSNPIRGAPPTSSSTAATGGPGQQRTTALRSTTEQPTGTGDMGPTRALKGGPRKANSRVSYPPATQPSGISSSGVRTKKDRERKGATPVQDRERGPSGASPSVRLQDSAGPSVLGRSGQPVVMRGGGGRERTVGAPPSSVGAAKGRGVEDTAPFSARGPGSARQQGMPGPSGQVMQLPREAHGDQLSDRNVSRRESAVAPARRGLLAVLLPSYAGGSPFYANMQRTRGTQLREVSIRAAGTG
uniref:Uncharacterized protein n=1 Tax=Chromera velia CCMP2878 TaxID=1169474 RepID=A0A0G4HQT3_9ALVE|eukprot:Cvel_1258.t1-p1 / transcript=Cvel_1258.t1 / gene=Cvel_1258 / organism=Chromera_velia_CCMP2878 / gene_product=Mucin-19, putative / transcript_product=Mucin-19, putative / location=Cvel_scaffold42:58371-67258(-) / protein_length=1460 / sequence_SO=supercontig / SO=protein_coding / is_pseudo=false